MSKTLEVDRRSLGAQVADAVRKLIMSGEYAQGEQLRQSEIAERLGVSRIPVREAFQQLESEGLLTALPYKGAVVSKLSEDEVREYFDIRATLEAELIGEAIKAISGEQIARARATLERLNNAPANEWGDLNWALHAELYTAANRPITLEFVKKIHDNLDRYVRIQLALSSQNRERANSEHRRLIDLCEEKKKREAVKLVKEHITGARDDLLRHLKTHP